MGLVNFQWRLRGGHSRRTTVTLTPEVNYACDGAGIITATPDIASYNYTYALDGVPNSPDPTSNVFLNVPPGTYTVSTNYSSSTPPTPSLLLQEDFGSGSTIPSPNTNGYNYEDQTPDPPGDGNSNINDFEYSVTSDVVAPFGAWLSPIDHTSGTRSGQGRYLVMNVGTPTPAQIIYSKEINDIIPGQDLSISFYVMNLLRQGTGGLDPDLTVEVREVGTGNIVQSVRTGAIAKNTGNLDWKPFSETLNPNGNASLEFVIRSEITGNGGNDFALDDIEIFQVPEVCEMTVETPVTVEAAKVFSASITASSNVSCNGQNDANITFEVENFDAATGFEYSIDGGALYTTSTTSPVTTTAALDAGTHNIMVRKVTDPSCSLTLTHAITEPPAIVADATITTPFTCNNTGATITASATNGIAPYEYRLEDTSGAVLRPYQTGTAFNNVGNGNYIIRARDGKGCDDEIDAPIAVTSPVAIAFTAEPTLCYSGAGDATITVHVSGGNGGFLFSINGSPFEMPNPGTPNSYVFANLGSGSYTYKGAGSAGMYFCDSDH